MTLPEVLDASALARAATGRYANWPLARVDEHVVRLSVMTEPFHWHHHPDSDEIFLVMEGLLEIAFEEGAVELSPGQMLTVPAGRVHRTRPLTGRSVNLTFEKADAATIKIEPQRDGGH